MSPDALAIADADEVIGQCLNPDKPTSFFLFAGAGSGKTRSLVTGLKRLQKDYGEQMRLRAQQVSVITYTNAACDEIQRRLEYDPLFHVSTIHSFIWDLIKGFNRDIRDWLKTTLQVDKTELESLVAKGKPSTKIYGERVRKIESIKKRLELLPDIKQFVYNPNGDNRGRDSLNHAEVIKIGSDFLANKDLMQRLLIARSPILLIDESQDTNKLLMESLMQVQSAHKSQFALGLLGDTMQRIYADGKVDIDRNLPDDWEKPAKLINHRCPTRVIDLINKVRSSVDEHQQVPAESAIRGHVRLFVTLGGQGNEQEMEQVVREKMSAYSDSPDWVDADGPMTLILEHHMAARRMGFFAMYEPLYKIDRFKNGLRDGTLSALKFFSDTALPVLMAKRDGQDFQAMNVVRKYSPLLKVESLRSAGGDQKVRIVEAKQALDALSELCLGKSPSFQHVLNCIAKSKLFEIPNSLYPYVTEDDVLPSEDVADDSDGDDASEDESVSEKMNAFLASPFWQIEKYVEYVRADAVFGTHQGVKGLEFPRVLVVMDDATAGGFLFSYEKFFGAKAESRTDTANAASGKETVIDRTRRLFYVTCSRCEESLAVIAYTSDPDKTIARATAEGWFNKDEVERI